MYDILHSFILSLFSAHPSLILFWCTLKSVFSPPSPHFSFLSLPIVTHIFWVPLSATHSIAFPFHLSLLFYSTSISPPSPNTCPLLKSQQCLKKNCVDNWPAEQSWTCHLYPSQWSSAWMFLSWGWVIPFFFQCWTASLWIFSLAKRGLLALRASMLHVLQMPIINKWALGGNYVKVKYSVTWKWHFKTGFFREKRQMLLKKFLWINIGNKFCDEWQK